MHFATQATALCKLLPAAQNASQRYYFLSALKYKNLEICTKTEKNGR